MSRHKCLLDELYCCYLTPSDRVGSVQSARENELASLVGRAWDNALWELTTLPRRRRREQD